MLTLKPMIVPAEIVLIDDPQEFASFMAEREDAGQWPEDDFAATQCFGQSDRILVVIALNLDRHKPGDMVDVLDTLTHEAVHVWQNVRDVMQETSPGHESEAYFVAGLVHWMASAVLPRIRS